MASGQKKRKVSFLKSYFTFVLIWTFFGFGFDSFFRRPPRTSARKKACMSNCRVLMGAFEMYNMDHNYNHASCEVPLDPSPEMKGYYKKISKPDSKCSYSYEAETETVRCVFHGGPWDSYNESNNSKPKNPRQEKVEANRKYWKELIENFLDYMRYRYLSDFPSRFIVGLILPIYFIFGFLALIASFLFRCF